MKKRVSIGLTITLLASGTTSAFASEHHPHPKQIKNVEFQSMNAPTTIEDMIKTYTNASVKVTYKDGSVKETPLKYNQLFLSKDKIVDNKGEMIAAGTPIDVNGYPIIDRSVPDQPTPYVSDAPDSNSFITINGKSYIISHYEYESIDNAGEELGGLPASMTLTQVDRNDETGELTVNHAKKIDFANVNGLWTPCNGSTTEWGTHLGSEEYEPDARAYEEDPSSDAYKDVNSFAERYFGDASKANPYFYGWIPEISVDDNGEASVVKHYSTGRFSHEMMQVLPDNKTALFGDDGNNTMMFMYVADKEKDFSAGTLYAAKFKQKSGENGGKGDLQWIKLGHSTDDEVKSIIDKGVTFSDIFETSDEPKEGFTAVKTAASKKVEYLKVKPGMEKAAAFLESRRYGAILGATSEFNKMEGLSVNKKDKKAYMAISYQNSAMLKQPDAVQDDIQLPHLESGVTYQLNMAAGQKDQSKGKIDSRYVPASMEGLVIGEDLEQADAYGNTANPDKIANPDNLTYSEDMNTLFIGEDSDMHTNNFVWAYNVKTKKLSRILSVPVGAEATGLRAVENIENSRYLLSNYQHPGEKLGKKDITAVDRDALEKAMRDSIGIQETGGVGYVSGLPSNEGPQHKKH